MQGSAILATKILEFQSKEYSSHIKKVIHSVVFLQRFWTKPAYFHITMFVCFSGENETDFSQLNFVYFLLCQWGYFFVIGAPTLLGPVKVLYR